VRASCLNVRATYAPTQAAVSVDLAVLPPFFNGLLDELPWWAGTWRVTQVEPAKPHEFASHHDRQRYRFTEVSVPGTLSDGAGLTFPFVARVRFEGDRLLRFQAKIADMIVGPALSEAGAPERHPFGVVLRRLMDSRGLSVKDLAMQTGRAMSTINAARAGWHIHQLLLEIVPGGCRWPRRRDRVHRLLSQTRKRRLPHQPRRHRPVRAARLPPP
jgi:hypothetical protein